MKILKHTVQYKPGEEGKVIDELIKRGNKVRSETIKDVEAVIGDIAYQDPAFVVELLDKLKKL